MRKIKFRAWDKNSKKWLWTSFDRYCYESHADLPLEIRTGRYHIGNNNYDYIEFTQYTGLKDKNGVEIFENDILKQPDNMSCRFKEKGLVRYESDYGGYIVEGEYSKNQHHETLTCDVAFDCEVIGNIYQHPHLLTENKQQ